jgi:transposase
MEEAWLRSRLESGRSIESIAREVGKHPSTVGYWVKKYGLVSSHSDRHAARGGLDRESLSALVAEGLSTRGVAERLGVSQATVRHWLARYGLETARAARRRSLEASLVVRTDGDASGLCPRHGQTLFRRRSTGAWRCLRCRAEAVVARRRAVKARLVADAGGACLLCGYQRCLAALQFHHLDPGDKKFTSHIAVLRGRSPALVRRLRNASCCAPTATLKSRSGSLLFRPNAPADSPG